MSQQITLLCLVVLTYFFLPVLSQDEYGLIYPDFNKAGDGSIYPNPILPPNPCPETFSYVRKVTGQMEGRINVPFDSSGTLDLHVNGSLQGYFGSKTNLKIKLLTDTNEIFDKTTPTLLYRVTFPTQKSIPRITHIDLNGVVYCSGPAWEVKLGGPPITSMYSLNRFYFKGAPRNQAQLLDDDDMNLADDDYTFSDNEVQYA